MQLRLRIRCAHFGRYRAERFRLQWFDLFHGRVARSGSLMVHLAGDVKTSTYGFAWGSSFRSSFISLGLNAEFILKLAAGWTTSKRTSSTWATLSSTLGQIQVCRCPSCLPPQSPQTPTDACCFARAAFMASEQFVLELLGPGQSMPTSSRSTCSTSRPPRDCSSISCNILD